MNNFDTAETIGQSLLELTYFDNFDSLPQSSQQKLVAIYKEAFAQPPYEENFDDDTARQAFEYIQSQQGNFVMGSLFGDPISFAAGYVQDNGTYFIEELAVALESQGKGFGRETITKLLDMASLEGPSGFELRTSIKNTKALNLYSSLGFTADYAQTEQVSNLRQDGLFKLDERIYLSKPLTETDMPKEKELRRTVIAYPSGNTTAIVFDRFPKAEGQSNKQLNSEIMQAWEKAAPEYPQIEQCCFVTTPQNNEAIARVQMFGGEFCGNATRSVIRTITDGQEYYGSIEVSGVEKPLEFAMEKDGTVRLEMPLPQDRQSLIQPTADGILVKLDGIAQLVVLDDRTDPRLLLQTLLAENRYSLQNEPAVGVSVYDQNSRNAKFCVWVNAVDTIFDETACGSGTCACGVALAYLNKDSVELEIVQPSGEPISTKCKFDSNSGSVIRSEIAGKVDIIYDGGLKL